jgi:hypothetical protein
LDIPWMLAGSWDGSELVVIEDTEHTRGPTMTAALIAATDGFAHPTPMTPWPQALHVSECLLSAMGIAVGRCVVSWSLARMLGLRPCRDHAGATWVRFRLLTHPDCLDRA